LLCEKAGNFVNANKRGSSGQTAGRKTLIVTALVDQSLSELFGPSRAAGALLIDFNPQTVARGVICGLMTALGAIGHTLPFLISDFHIALAAAASWVRHRYMETRPLSAAVEVGFGGRLGFSHRRAHWQLVIRNSGLCRFQFCPAVRYNF
jgi:hypothetical protein